MRRGESMPPIDVYRIGSLHFVRDGHHRVSVARELGLEVIEAYVTEIITDVGADADVQLHDLALKSHSGCSSSASLCPRSCARGSSCRAAPGTRGSPRASRPGAFARCRRAASS